MRTYDNKAAQPIAAVIPFTKNARIINETTPRQIPIVSAAPTDILPSGSGRFFVRVIRASVSRSNTMLSAFAEPTDIQVPTNTPTKVVVVIDSGANATPPTTIKTHIAVTDGLVSSHESRNLADHVVEARKSGIGN